MYSPETVELARRIHDDVCVKQREWCVKNGILVPALVPFDDLDSHLKNAWFLVAEWVTTNTVVTDAQPAQSCEVE